MALVRYEPWHVVNRLHQTLDQVFNNHFSNDSALGSPEASSSSSVSWVPRVDIHE